jgi:ankyrin repeat protein
MSAAADSARVKAHLEDALKQARELQDLVARLEQAHALPAERSVPPTTSVPGTEHDGLEQALDAGGEGTVPSCGEATVPSAAASELCMLLKSMEMECVLAESFPGKTIEDFLAQERSEVEDKVDDAKKAIVDAIMGVLEKAKAVKKREAPGGNKFTAELRGGSVETFLGGVTGLVGEPHPDIERGMAEEHLDKPDSHTGFTASNYPTTSTPAIEFAVVVTAMGITTGPASKTLQAKLEEWKGHQSSNRWLTRAKACGFEKESGFRKKETTDHNGKTWEKTVVTQTVRSRQRDGEVPEDLRVLRPIQDYGNFREDGRLESFEACDKDTILQKRVKKARLTRMEIIALVLWTGPCFMLYNGLLRRFGNCGEVKSDVEFASPEFWELLSKVSVASRMKQAGHKYASTLHALASAVKKLQLIAEDGQGTRLYRGLGGLDVSEFSTSQGFSEYSFLSTTRSLDVALTYSGIKEGKVATVLAFDIFTVDNGADISDFSLYPSECETVWNSCAFLEYVRGRDTLHVTEWGVVRVLLVKINANTKALTVEELEERRKRVVVSMLDTIHTDVCRDLDDNVETDEFRKRLALENGLSQQAHYKPSTRQDFIASIKEESAARVQVYKDKEAAWFTSNDRLGKAVSDGLAISTLAKAKCTVWLRHPTLTLHDMSCPSSSFHDFARSYSRLLVWQQRELKRAEAEALKGSDEAAARLQALALEDCVLRRFISFKCKEELEHADDTTSATPLWMHVYFGESTAVERLLQARADPEAVPSKDDGHKTSLVCAAMVGNAEIVRLLVKYKANVQATDKLKRTALHLGALWGHAQVVEVLVQAKADVNAQDGVGYTRTPLHLAALWGHTQVVEALVQGKADVDAQDDEVQGINTPLHLAAREGHVQMIEALVQAKADVDTQDKLGRTPLELALVNNRGQAAALLRTHAAR